jgi:tetratricopeptide (TPR) repeat protein
MFMGYGSTMTAFEIFNELQMWEEAINCLYIAGKTQRAKDLANERLKICPEPSILVALGELLKEEKYFLQAIEMSGGKYTKAYRAAGYYYFNLGRLDKAISNFELALQTNPLFPKIWFTLGCLYLQNRLFEKAVNAFSQSVALEEDNCK